MSYDLNEQAARNARRDVELAALKAGRDVWKDRADTAEADHLAELERQNRAMRKAIKMHCVQLRLDALSVWAADLENKVSALRATKKRGRK